MKILIVHNDYGKYSGEEAVVDRMIADGRRAGFEIETLRRTSKFSRDNLVGKVKGFFSGIFSWEGRRMMREALRNFRPDIVHIHNLYPFISPAVLPLCRRAGVPVVMSVHNYRLICPTGLFLRDGKPCELCLASGNEVNCLRHNCEDNWFRSLGYALRNAVARWTKAYLDNVDYFCCLTEFQRAKLIAAGFDRDKMIVMPNYVEYVEPDSANEGCDTSETADFVGYVGRLSKEKGYDLLLEVARRHPEIPFRFAGALRDERVIAVPPNVELCGLLTPGQLAAFYAASRFIVAPSRCYEGFPMSLLEASSHARCCVAPAHGAFAELMTAEEAVCGRLFKPLDINDLEQQIVDLWNDREEARRLGALAEENYRRRFLKRNLNIRWDTILKSIASQKSPNGGTAQTTQTTKQ